MLQVLARQWRLVTAISLLCLAAAAARLLTDERRHTISTRIVVKQNPLKGTASAGPESAESRIAFLNTQSTILTSRPILAIALSKPGVRDMKLFERVEHASAFLKEEIRVKAGQNDNIITVEMDTPHREDGERLLDTLIESYITYQTRQKRSLMEDLTRLLRDEKEKASREISRARDGMVQLKKSARTIDFAPPENLPMLQLQKLTDALAEAKLDTLAAESAYRDAAAAYQTPQRAARLEEMGRAGAFDAGAEEDNRHLRFRIFEEQQKLAELRRFWMANHPQVQAAQSRLDTLVVGYMGAVKRRWMAALEREESVKAALPAQEKLAAEFAARSADLVEKAADYARLEQEVDRLEKDMERTYAAIEKVRAQETVDALTIDHFEPAGSSLKPTSPKVPQTLALTLAAGLMLGIAGGYLRERVNPRLHTPQEIQASLRLPVLGLVPRLPASQHMGNQGLISRDDPLSEAAEAYRMIRTAVQFRSLQLGIEGRGISVLITSPDRDDGKTTLASNLAVVLAQSGKQVLLIDADLRCPAQHQLLGCTGSMGLSLVLMGEDAAQVSIQRTAVERLSILPAGPIPINPSELLNSERFQGLINELSRRYDFVICDSPPTTLVSDARIIAAACDTALLVVRARKTGRRLAERACDGLLSVGARMMGIVVNQSPRSGGQSQGGYYSSNYAELPAPRDPDGAVRPEPVAQQPW